MCKDKCNWWLLGLCAIAAIAMIAGIGWFYTHPNKKTSQHTTNQQTTVAHVNPENNQYLQAAKKILDQFDGHTDNRGFYGASQHCSWTNGQEPACIVETMDYLDDGQPIASHRQTLPVIWARYQYYHATGDQEQLAKMHTDLENLWQILNDKTFTLQTNRYNCFLMLDLIQAEDIDYEDRLRARDICRQAEFEYAPGSDLQYDLRLAHLPYKFMTPIAQEEWSTEFPVVTDYEGSVDPEKLVTYNYQSLINDIDNLIEKIANNDNSGVTASVDITTAREFMQRELLAALDQIPGIMLETDSASKDNLLTSQRIYDYLVLTRETLNWYLAYGGEELDEDNLCLLYQNVTAYTMLIDNRNTKNDKQAFSNLQKESTLPYCMLTAHNISGEELNKDQILNNIRQNNAFYDAEQWPMGAITNYNNNNGDYIWSVDLNALLAGTLAIEE